MSDNALVHLPRGRKNRETLELAFLPAALEIVETPPSPIGRAIGRTIIALFCLALLWAGVGTIDIVASAPGKILPSGRTKTIQPLEIGVVRAIHVQDGQAVKAGDVLIELDPTISKAEVDHLQSDLIVAQLDIARLRAALSETDDPLANFHPPEGASPALIEVQRQFLIQQTTEHLAKLAAIDRQKAQKEAEQSTIRATIDKIEATLPVVQQRFDIRSELHEQERGTKLAYLESLQQLLEQRAEIVVQKSRYEESAAAVAAIIQTRAQAVAEFQRTLFADLTEAERKASGFAQDLIRAKQRNKFQVLTAPVDGVVQQLAVHTVGGVVSPAQALLVIVPLDSHLEIEAMVSNRDIGFVEADQPVEIKVDTFNFTRYGLLHGRVISVSKDAITREKPSDKSSGDKTSSPQTDTSEPKGQELVYAARVSLDRAQMQVDDKFINLAPGMAVTVEIKTGSRAVISYLLSPLLRYQHDSFRER